MAANNYLVCSWCQTKLDAYAADGSLSDEERAAKVCEVGVEALRGLEAVLLHNLQKNCTEQAGRREVRQRHSGGAVGGSVCHADQLEDEQTARERLRGSVNRRVV